MLKSALGDRIKEKTHHKDDDTGNEEVEDGTEETLSQHSDGIVEYGPKKTRPGTYPRETERGGQPCELLRQFHLFLIT